MSSIAGEFMIDFVGGNGKRSEKDEEITKDFTQLKKSSVIQPLQRLAFVDMINTGITFALVLVAMLIWLNSGTTVQYAIYYSAGRFYMKDSEQWEAATAWKNHVEACTDDSLYVEDGVSTTWNGVSYPLLFATMSAGHVSPWPITMVVLIFTFLFSLMRVLFSENGLFLYEPTGPDFFRWIEYFITSPLILLLVALVSGIRDVYVLTLIVAAQATMVILGYLLELLISQAWDVLYHRIHADAQAISDEGNKNRIRKQRCGSAQSGTSTPASQGSTVQARSDKSSECDDNFQEQIMEAAQEIGPDFMLLLSHMKDHISDKAYFNAMVTLCSFKVKKQLPWILFKIFMVWAIAWLTFVLIWVVIMGAFRQQASVFDNKCTPKPPSNSEDPVEVPFIAYVFAYGQLILFALFGVASTVHVVGMWISVRRDAVKTDNDERDLEKRLREHGGKQLLQDYILLYKDYYKDRVHNFINVTWFYTILNVAAKALLAICIIFISAMYQE